MAGLLLLFLLAGAAGAWIWSCRLVSPASPAPPFPPPPSPLHHNPLPHHPQTPGIPGAARAGLPPRPGLPPRRVHHQGPRFLLHQGRASTTGQGGPCRHESLHPQNGEGMNGSGRVTTGRVTVGGAGDGGRLTQVVDRNGSGNMLLPALGEPWYTSVDLPLPPYTGYIVPHLVQHPAPQAKGTDSGCRLSAWPEGRRPAGGGR